MDSADFRTIGKAIKDGARVAGNIGLQPIDVTRKREIGECVAYELELVGYRIVKESELDKK